MENIYHTNENRLSNAIGRWAGLGPYYAMFPVPFAFDVVEKFCPPKGAIIDPFAGRASSLYAAVVTGRQGYGIEINKVGWLYGYVKLNPAELEPVLARNNEMGGSAQYITMEEIAALPEFFRYCYTEQVLRYLLTVRAHLDWQNNPVDATLMAILLVYLHGAKEKSLSNQTRQSKAMAPEYSVNWWRENDSQAPDVDPIAFMRQRIEWRYKHGTPKRARNRILLGDSTKLLETWENDQSQKMIPRFDLLFTSPPYYKVTSYYYDQWLRLWLLGEPNQPKKSGGEWQGDFGSQIEYKSLLHQVFSQASYLMKRKSIIYVRTDARKFTLETTENVLRECFPKKTLRLEVSPLKKSNQTALYGDKSKKPGEVDIILS